MASLNCTDIFPLLTLGDADALTNHVVNHALILRTTGTSCKMSLRRMVVWSWRVSGGPTVIRSRCTRIVNAGG